MSKPQIAVRIPPLLLEELDSYVERTGTSRTDVVVSAIATYLGCSQDVPLSQRVAEKRNESRRSLQDELKPACQ